MPYRSLTAQTPIELRAQFSENLKRLISSAPSVAEACRQIGINRTQFNRYLNGESYPRPDVLRQICDYFGVDARILMEPLDENMNLTPDLLHHPALRDFFTHRDTPLNEEIFPSGFYLMTRRSHSHANTFVRVLLYAKRSRGLTLMRGYVPRDVILRHDSPHNAQGRETRGIAFPQNGGIAFLMTTRGARTLSFSHVMPFRDSELRYLSGFMVHTLPEAITTHRGTRIVLEWIEQDSTTIMGHARKQGFIELKDITPFEERLLRPDEPFG